MVPSLNTLLDTKSIFCHQVQFFSFFYYLKSVEINLGWVGDKFPQIIWLHPLNDLEVLVIKNLEKNYQKLVILPQFLGKNKIVS